MTSQSGRTQCGNRKTKARELGLSLKSPKSFNFVVLPRRCSGSLFCGVLDARRGATMRRGEIDAQFSAILGMGPRMI